MHLGFVIVPDYDVIFHGWAIDDSEDLRACWYGVPEILNLHKRPPK
jgi:hypothetical protein